MFGAIAGGWGDSGLNLSEHSSETATYAKVLFFPHGFSASILMVFWKVQYMGPLFFATTITLVKISTLVLYKRIFTTKLFHLAAHLMMALTAGWFLASILVGTLLATWSDPSNKATNPGWNILIQTSLKGSRRPRRPICYRLCRILALHGCDQHRTRRDHRFHAPVCDTSSANVLSPQSTGVWNLPTGLVVSSCPSTILHADTNSAPSSCIIAAAARVYYLGVISHAADGPGTESQRKPPSTWNSRKNWLKTLSRRDFTGSCQCNYVVYHWIANLHHRRMSANPGTAVSQ